MKIANSIAIKHLIASEDVESERLARDLLYLQRLGKIKLFTHIGHETYTTSIYAKRRNKRLGVMKGFPDYVILIRDKVIFLEMKRTKKGVVSPEQKEWIEGLDNKTTKAVVCKGHLEAMSIIHEELRLHE